VRRYTEGGSFEAEAGYSRAVRHGQLIAVSGTTCRDEVIGLGTHAQAADCLQRLVAAVERLGGSRTDIYRTRLFLAPGADWREASRAHQELLGVSENEKGSGHQQPSRRRGVQPAP
jgi:enamine deaminase RidA (YjgF/YER057c/UK114 family)